MSCNPRTLLTRIINGTTRFHEFLRFGLVGLLATGLHYLIYIILLALLSPSIAYTIGYGISLLMNFFLSNFFTFKTKPNMKKGVGFGISHGINYLLHMLLLNLFLWLNVPDEWAPIPVFAIVIPVNFILVRTVLKSKRL
jgi:putative flippase GtrA